MQAAQLAKSVSYLSYACLERGGGLGEAVSALKTIQTHRRATQMLSVAQEDPRRFLARLITSDRSHMGSNSALYAAQVLAYAASLRSPKGQPSTLDPETGPRTALLANPWGALGGSDLLSAGSEASK